MRRTLAAVDDPVADGADLFNRFDDAVIGIRENAQHPLDCSSVLEDLTIILVGLSIRDLEHQPRVGEADLLDLADREGQVLVGVHSFEVGLDDLKLDRRRSTVED